LYGFDNVKDKKLIFFTQNEFQNKLSFIFADKSCIF